MQRFFVDIKKNNSFVLSQEQVFQITKVLRYKTGQEIEIVFNGDLYLCAIESINQNIKLSTIKKLDENREANIEINLYQSLIKKDKFEWLIQKAVELGVSSITPIITQRSVVKIDKKTIESKLIRWNKIALEACEQSKRLKIPIIRKPIKIDKIKKLKGNSILAYEKKWLTKSNSFKKIISSSNDNIYNIFIGPEGGIKESELETLESIGFKSVSLGKRILRSETAAIMAISSLIYEKDLK